MSDKKQTAVEWLIEQLDKLEYEYENKGIGVLKYIDRSKEIRNQAKQMEKEQMIEFIKKAPIKTGLLREPDIYYIIDAESHYNETYGGNNDN
jgi:uncharacterized protein (DUF302 family)